MRSIPYLLTVTAALIIMFGWTSPAQTSDPMLHGNELPMDVLNHCGVQTVADGRIVCRVDEAYSRRWIGKTPKGHLFLVAGGDCVDAETCRAWFVEKTRNGVTVLLTVDGYFRLWRNVHGYPRIQARTRMSDTRSAYSTYEWKGDHYTRTQSKVVYRVEGVECGTLSECDRAARDAVGNKDYDRAVRIWETVHGVSWI